MGAGKQWNDIIKVQKENINYHPRILYSEKTILHKGFPGGSDGKALITRKKPGAESVMLVLPRNTQRWDVSSTSQAGRWAAFQLLKTFQKERQMAMT